MPNQTKKQYQSELGHTKAFFVPHPIDQPFPVLPP